MLGIDIGERKWQSYGTWQENGTFGQTLNNQQVTFNIASKAINESFEMNYIIPFYTKFQTYNKANLYFGAMFGLMTTVNDGSMGYSKLKGSVDSGTAYVSSYDYGYGIGYNFGLALFQYSKTSDGPQGIIRVHLFTNLLMAAWRA